MPISDPSFIRILLLEDEPLIRQTIKRMLRGFGNIDIREGADGSEGIRLMDDGFSPDVVLCDVQMEPMNGLTFLREVRESRDLARAAVPVIMLTVATDADTVRAAVSLKVSSYLVKPISVARLVERLTAALHGGSGQTISQGAAPKVLRQRQA